MKRTVAWLLRAPLLIAVIGLLFATACTSADEPASGPAASPTAPAAPTPPPALRLDPADGEAIHVLTGHTDAVDALAVLPDGRLVSASRDKTIRVWDLNDLSQHHVIDQPDLVNTLEVLPDGRFVSGRNDNVLTIWDPTTLAPVAEFDLGPLIDGRAFGIRDLTIIDNSHVLLIVDSIHGHVLNIETGDLRQLVSGFDFAMTTAVLPDGSVAVGSTLNELKYWRIENRSNWFDIDVDVYEPDDIQGMLSGNQDWGNVALAALPDGRLVHGSAFGLVRVIDPANPGEVLDLGDLEIESIFDDEPPTYTVAHDGPVYAIATTNDGRVISTGSDRLVRVFDLDQPGSPAVLRGHTDWVVALTVLGPNLIASGAFDNTIRIWDLSDQRNDL